MSESAKVRLVRCPKCQNLLQELNDYSIYQCGGCGVVLRASKMNGDLETFSEKSDEDRIRGVSEKVENLEFSEKKMNLSDESEDGVMLIGGSLSKEPRRVKQDRFGKMSKLDGESPRKWLVEEGTKVDNNINRLRYAEVENEYEDFKPSDMNGSGFRRSGQMPDRRFRGRGEIESSRSSQMIDIEHKRYAGSSYSGGGPSKNYSDFRYGESLKDGYGGSGSDKVEYAGDDRAELLKKIDELKDQLSRSGEITNKQIEKNPRHGWNAHHDHHYSASEDWFSDSSSGIHRPFTQYSFPDNHPARASYMNHYAEPSAYGNVHGMGSRHSVYPNENPRSRIKGSNDPLRSQIPMRVQNVPAPFQEQRNQGYLSGHYSNSDLAQMDAYEAYAPNMNHHHPSCTCLYCYKKNQNPNQRFSGISHNRVPNHLGNPVSLHVPHQYGLGVPKMPQFLSFNPQSHSRWPSDVDSEVSSFAPRRPPKIQPSNGVHYCRAIAAGAPFITCNNCFELLEVPKKVMVQNGIQKKMRCGPCSSIIVLKVSNKGLVVSVHEAVQESPPVVDDRAVEESRPVVDDSQKVKLMEDNLNAQGRPNRASMTLSSEDYDHSGYEFKSLDREVVPHITHQPGLTKTARTKSLQSASSSTSEDEANLAPMAASLKHSNPSELPMSGKEPSPASGSSLQEYFEYSNKYHRGDRFEKGNRSRHSDPESLVPSKTISRQTSMKDASEATEIDISTNEYGNTGTSLDSGEPSKEGDQLRAKKAAFLGGIMKSFKDSKSNLKDEPEKANVTVNGYLIPVRLIKKAEKVAGPIQPGNYWYDFRAGFWGVMGGPCRGIIPPFIEEFNHILPENCAGGNTRVFVNTRELHHTDFNLLVSRGLPNETDRSYIVEISGRVLDAETGEELESLGKLAPTVERVKHGFGMKPPRATA